MRIRWLFPLSFALCLVLNAQKCHAELFRLRVGNVNKSPVQVSTDKGGRWTTIGQVVRRATRLAPIPVRGAIVGQVVRVSLSGHWLSLRPGGNGVMGLQIVPSSKRPSTGWTAEALVVDIPAGSSLFRNLAPLPGSKVFLEGPDGRPKPLPSGYRLKSQDKFIIIVDPPSPLKEVTIENWTGGKVRSIAPDGKEEIVGTVKGPLLGVGALPGADGAGAGRLAAAWEGGWLISTTPRPAGRNSSGIELVASSSKGSSWQLTIEPGSSLLWQRAGLGVELEGGAEIKVDNGPWERLFERTGPSDRGWTSDGLKAYFQSKGQKREVSSGVTHLRIRFPALKESYLSDQIALAKRGTPVVSTRKIPSGAVSGVLAINARLKNAPNIRYVTFSVDGKLRAVMNTEPFQYTWNTTEVPDGRHTIEVKGLDDSGNVIAAEKKVVYVINGVAPSREQEPPPAPSN